MLTSRPSCAELERGLARLGRARTPSWPSLRELHGLLTSHHPRDVLAGCACPERFALLLRREIARLDPEGRALLPLLLARAPGDSPFPTSLPVLTAALAGSTHPTLIPLRRLAAAARTSPLELVVIPLRPSFLHAALSHDDAVLACGDEFLVRTLPGALADALSPELELCLRLPLAVLDPLSEAERQRLGETLLRAASSAAPSAALVAALAARTAQATSTALRAR